MAGMTRWRWAAVPLVALVWGVVAAWWTPRGPLTNGQALGSIGLSLAAGGLAGWLSRSRWSMLVAPVVFVAALELARLGIRGPSVDAVRFSPFGFIALVAGRGVHGLLSVLPMAVGAVYGAGVARRGQPAGGRMRHVRRVGAALFAAVVVLVTVAVAIPGRTAPIPGGVAELTRVDVNGHRLGLMIRGASGSAPVLLFVPGAPGSAEFGAVRRHLAELERHFVVVTLDRRGGGTSYPALDPTSTMTLDNAVADTVAVADYLRRRFGQDRIALLAHSGGSLIGALAVQRRPELFRAYIGTGQAVNLPAFDRVYYDDLLAWARSTRRTALERQLTAQGPPPYRDFFAYEPLMLYQNEVYAYDHAGGFDETLDAAEYTILEKAHTLNAIMDSWSALYPTMQDVDLRRDARQLSVPVYFVQGAREMRGLAEPFAQWYEVLQAPRKHLTTVEDGGHRAMFERPERLVEVLTRMLTET
jgi:pimeloyl-ACP methyl ester carboxylesterase